MTRRRSLAALMLTALLAPAVAQAAPEGVDRASARALAAEGQEVLTKKDFTTAVDRFGRADALVHAPPTLLGLARAQLGLGKLVAAQEAYDRLVREGVAPRSPAAWSKTVGLIVGGLGATAGAVLLINAPPGKPAASPQVTPVVGLGYLGAKGTF